jgi:hypothetical protein
MNPDAIFGAANLLALAGWVTLLASPFAPRFSDRIGTFVIPMLLSIAYAGLIMAFWSGAEGGFGSLDEVSALFRSRELLLAGWLHYLAFDLFVGAWIVRTARESGVAFWLVIPCLVLTFLFGPVGFLLFNAIRVARPASAAATA